MLQGSSEVIYQKTSKSSTRSFPTGPPEMKDDPLACAVLRGRGIVGMSDEKEELFDKDTGPAVPFTPPHKVTRNYPPLRGVFRTVPEAERAGELYVSILLLPGFAGL
jgi:hypothetical protein